MVPKLHHKSSADEFKNAGDYYFVDKLASTDSKVKAHQAIVLKCPFCKAEMASTAACKIIFSRSLWRKWLGLPERISVTPMLQCPYNTSHRFKVKNDKVKAI